MPGAQAEGAALVVGDDVGRPVRAETVEQLVTKTFQERIGNAGEKTDTGLPAFIKQKGSKHGSGLLSGQEGITGTPGDIR